MDERRLVADDDGRIDETGIDGRRPPLSIDGTCAVQR
jgi:hypothetical protein